MRSPTTARSPTAATVGFLVDKLDTPLHYTSQQLGIPRRYFLAIRERLVQDDYDCWRGVIFLPLTMTELLEQVIARLKTLPAGEQNAIAAIILEELEAEIRWDAAFAKSHDALAKLAGEAMAEYRAGKTQESDPESIKVGYLQR